MLVMNDARYANVLLTVVVFIQVTLATELEYSEGNNAKEQYTACD